MNLLDFNNWSRLTENTEDSTDYSKNNLGVIHYRNGDPIPEVKDPLEWSNLTTGAYCQYDNDLTEGILYNWYAVNDPRGLAPAGWKIPTIDELEKIDLTIGLPGGFRYFNGNFNYTGYFGYWWSSTEDSLNSTNGDAARNNTSKEVGLSVRCILDFDSLSNLLSDF
jgi:hypothetical protein